jgi:hypothetical protein
VTVIIPSRHAINQAFRTIHSSSDVNGTDRHWLSTFRPSVLRQRLCVDALERDLVGGVTATSLTGMRRTDGRRLGKPQTTFDIGRLVPDRFVIHDRRMGWTGEEQAVVVLRRETVIARRNHLEERSSPSGIAVTRHALERLYERERCDHDGIHERILRDLGEADHTLAFAVAAGLFACGGPMERDAYTMLPLGRGMLIVRNMAIAMYPGTSPVTRYSVEKMGIMSLPVANDRQRRLSIAPIAGMAVEGHLLAVGVTYLSPDLLRIEQTAYNALFRREAARFDLADIAADAGRTWLHHERRVEPARIEVDPRLHYLLSQIAPPRAPGRTCLSVGWAGRRPEGSGLDPEGADGAEDAVRSGEGMNRCIT